MPQHRIRPDSTARKARCPGRMTSLDLYKWLLALGAGIMISSLLLNSIDVFCNGSLAPILQRSFDSRTSEQTRTALPATTRSSQLQSGTSADCPRSGRGCGPRAGQDDARHPTLAPTSRPDSLGDLLVAKLLQEKQAERLSTLKHECKLLAENGSITRSPSPHSREWPRLHIYVADRYKLMYCEVPKTGCTNWKRTFLALTGNFKLSRVMTQEEVHGFNYTKLSSFDAAGQRSRLDSYTMAMFVREPMERLVSAYRDKFQHSKHYKKAYGRAIISRYRKSASRSSLIGGHGVTFPEFARFILDPERPLEQDVHWLPAHELCQPCQLRFDFLGKVETAGRDAADLLARVGAPESVFYSSPTHKRSSAMLVGQYLAQLTPQVRQQLYEFYSGDYRLFGYPLPSDAIV